MRRGRPSPSRRARRSPAGVERARVSYRPHLGDGDEAEEGGRWAHLARSQAGDDLLGEL